MQNTYPQQYSQTTILKATLITLFVKFFVFLLGTGLLLLFILSNQESFSGLSGLALGLVLVNTIPLVSLVFSSILTIYLLKKLLHLKRAAGPVIITYFILFLFDVIGQTQRPLSKALLALPIYGVIIYGLYRIMLKNKS